MSDSTKLSIGIVKNNADPDQDGRLQIFIPSIDSRDYKVEDLPWAYYVSPFGGTTANFKVGRESKSIPGATSYGFWAIPKNGARVLCGFLEGDINVRFWVGCFYMPDMNRTLPQSSDLSTEIDESGAYPKSTIPHYQENLTQAGLGQGSLHYKTRGGWQRSVSYPANRTTNKPGSDGYAAKPLEKDKADSQIFSWTTPGRHYIAMSDVAEECRIRIKTTEGSQIILDDTNERIYISTAKGKNYIEIDESNGKMYFYTSSKFNVHSENDINLYSDQNINIVAKKRVNIQSEERGVKIQSKMGLNLISVSGDVKLTASRDIQLRTTSGGSSGGVGESISNSSVGLIRDFAEDAASGSSRISLDAADGIDIRAEQQSVLITGNAGVGVRTIGGDLTFQSGAGLNQMAKIYRSCPAPAKVACIPATVAHSVSPATSEDVKSKMVVPQHESWVRDEDEAIFKTPRNKSYQG
jgi:hypothetical protein